MRCSKLEAGTREPFGDRLADDSESRGSGQIGVLGHQGVRERVTLEQPIRPGADDDDLA